MEGLNIKVKYKAFGKKVGFKGYLYGVSVAGTKLRSGTHDLNEMTFFLNLHNVVPSRLVAWNAEQCHE